jgi:hypothetical protein
MSEKQDRYFSPFFSCMVDFTTAIIFQYVYFIPQKAKSLAIAYFYVACYSINWFHNLRQHFAELLPIYQAADTTQISNTTVSPIV